MTFLPSRIRAQIAMNQVVLRLIATVFGVAACSTRSEPGRSTYLEGLSQTSASALVRLPLRCIQQEYPNKPDHVMNNGSEVLSPQALHPAFYGCFDWHSAVHGHWMLVRVLRLFPSLPEGEQIRRVLDQNLSAENILNEVRYLDAPNRKSFERTYGWAWLLKLSQELESWNDPDAQRWAVNLKPLANAIVERFIDFLPRQNYPIRTGVHPNTAFGLAFALDYARSTNMDEFERMLRERARTYFGTDTEYPAQWEPGGEDFFSPALMEAELMARALPQPEFRKWFHRFLPHFNRRAYPNLLTPAIVTDRTDPKLVHLDGLNLSRVWSMQRIARALPENDPCRQVLLQSANEHLRATLPQITSGHYEGEHWLATFAIYALSEGAQ